MSTSEQSSAVEAHRAIAALFPFQVSVSVLSGDHGATTHRTIAQRRATRRFEFVRGRLCAQRALSGLGVFAASVERQADRTPLWPDGVLGSISHADALCAAVVARKSLALSLGLDIERIGAATPELRPLILAPEETPPVRFFGADNWLTALFSAKEAFYKCHFPLHRQFLDFCDWRASFDKRGERFGTFTMAPACGGHAPFSGVGFWSFDETHIYTGFSAPSVADQARAASGAVVDLI